MEGNSNVKKSDKKDLEKIFNKKINPRKMKRNYNVNIGSKKAL
jgi:hypothetical protein